MTRYKASNNKYDIWFMVPNTWYAWVTYCFSTPITDGKYIYVATANNAVAAVDLNGKIAWQVWEHLPGFKNDLGTAYTTSPVLMDGKLVVYHRNHVRAYEAATGKKIWQHIDPNAVHGAGTNAKKRTPSNYNWRCPEASSPNVTRLKLPDGSLMPVVLDGFQLIWRLEDGAMVCNNMPQHWKGNTSITRDDVYLFVHDGDRQPEYCGTGVRLKAESRDKVTWEWLWKDPDRTCGSLTPVLVGDRFIARFNSGRQPSVSHEMLTGKTQPLFGGKSLGGNTSPIVAGNKFYAFHWGKEFSAECNIGDLVSGEVANVPVAVKDDRLSGTDDFAKIHWHTMCGYQQNASPSAQANRILYRARGVLWCIGDKTQRFPAPRDCPTQARASK